MNEHHSGKEDTIPRVLAHIGPQNSLQMVKYAVSKVSSHFEGETLHGLSVVCDDLLNLNVIVVQKTQFHEFWHYGTSKLVIKGKICYFNDFEPHDGFG